MLDKTDREDTGLSQCPYCGSRFAAPLLFCPQCGANQRAASSAAAGFTPDDAPSRGFADRLRAYLGTLRGGSTPYGDDRYPPIDYEPIDEERELRRSRRPLYVGGALALVAFAVAAYLIVPGSEPGAMRRVQMIEGSVARAHHTPLDEDAPPAPQDIDIAGLNVPSGQSSPGTGIDIAGLNVPSGPNPPEAMPTLPESPALVPKTDTNARPDVTKQLAIARTDLNRNSLWPARRAIANALAAQPDNADAQRMRTELASRERERDSLIGHARQCARSRQWSCTRQYAERAASVDTSSRDAKRLLARASGSNRGETFARRGDPDLLVRLHRWFQQSIAQSEARPARQSPPPWDRDHP